MQGLSTDSEPASGHGMAQLPSAVALAVFILGFAAASLHPPLQRSTCQELYFEKQALDHFSWRPAPKQAASTWSQRYFFDKSHWQDRSSPIFFYGRLFALVTYVTYGSSKDRVCLASSCEISAPTLRLMIQYRAAGNEAPVDTYVSHTGTLHGCSCSGCSRASMSTDLTEAACMRTGLIWENAAQFGALVVFAEVVFPAGHIRTCMTTLVDPHTDMVLILICSIATMAKVFL